MIEFGWPQGIVVLLSLLGIASQKDNLTRGIQLAFTIPYFFVLYWGGFFS